MVSPSSPILHSPGTIFGSLLIREGLSHEYNTVTADEWPTYFDYEPESSTTDQQVACLSTTPTGEGYLQQDGRQIESLGVQLMTRHKNVQTSYTKAANVIKGVQSLSQETLSIDGTDYLIHSIRLASGPIRLGRNDAGYHRHSTNFLISVTVDI